MADVDYLNEPLNRKKRNELKPRARRQYIQGLILNTLHKDRDYTISEIMEETGLSRITVARHLDSLVFNHQILRKERSMGKIQIGFYKRADSIIKNEELRSKKDDSLSFSFFVLCDDDDSSICIQQKEEDEFGSQSVKGAITIPFDDVKMLITGLSTYSMKVINK